MEHGLQHWSDLQHWSNDSTLCWWSMTKGSETHFNPDKSCKRPMGADSAIMDGRDGELIGRYSKVHLVVLTAAVQAVPSARFHCRLLCTTYPWEYATTSTPNAVNPGPSKTGHTNRPPTPSKPTPTSSFCSTRGLNHQLNTTTTTGAHWAAHLRPLPVRNRWEPQPTPRDTFVVACNRRGHEKVSIRGREA